MSRNFCGFLIKGGICVGLFISALVALSASEIRASTISNIEIKEVLNPWYPSRYVYNVESVKLGGDVHPDPNTFLSYGTFDQITFSRFDHRGDHLITHVYPATPWPNSVILRDHTFGFGSRFIELFFATDPYVTGTYGAGFLFKIEVEDLGLEPGLSNLDGRHTSTTITDYWADPHSVTNTSNFLWTVEAIPAIPVPASIWGFGAALIVIGSLASSGKITREEY